MASRYVIGTAWAMGFSCQVRLTVPCPVGVSSVFDRLKERFDAKDAKVRDGRDGVGSICAALANDRCDWRAACARKIKVRARSAQFERKPAGWRAGHHRTKCHRVLRAPLRPLRGIFLPLSSPQTGFPRWLMHAPKLGGTTCFAVFYPHLRSRSFSRHQRTRLSSAPG